MKTCIIGTHGVGKTTLAYLLAAKLKMQGKSVKIVQEVARSCPFPLNLGMTREACLWIYHEQVKKELEAEYKFDHVICDRSAIDSFIYAKALELFEKYDDVMDCSYNIARDWMQTYNKIYYISGASQDLTPDGTRSTDKEFQLKVQEHFDWEMLELMVPKVRMSPDDIFKYAKLLEGICE